MSTYISTPYESLDLAERFSRLSGGRADSQAECVDRVFSVLGQLVGAAESSVQLANPVLVSQYSMPDDKNGSGIVPPPETPVFDVHPTVAFKTYAMRDSLPCVPTHFIPVTPEQARVVDALLRLGDKTAVTQSCTPEQAQGRVFTAGCRYALALAHYLHADETQDIPDAADFCPQATLHSGLLRLAVRVPGDRYYIRRVRGLNY